MSYFYHSKNRRVLSLLLCTVMLFSALTPVSAYADETDTTAAQEQTEEPTQPSEPAEEPTTDGFQEPTSEDATEPAEESPLIIGKKAPEKAETKVKGLKTNFNVTLSQKAEMKLTVKPANGGRKVLLQQYDTAKEKYVTRVTYKTGDVKKAKLRVAIPKKYRKKTLGYWRVVIKKSDTANKYVSERITVCTMNTAPLKLNARCACIMDVESGNVIYGKNLHMAHKQASTTKIMTAILLIESGKLDGTTRITKKVANTPYANVGLKAGDVYNNRDLLYSMMLPSSNESASAIATGVSVSQKAFVRKMNKKAKKLGFENTRFSNPHGLDSKKNHTTVYDLARMTSYASQYDEFLSAIAAPTYSFTSLKYKRHHTVRTTDKLKSYSKRHIGGKTGFTSGAGYCFSSVYKYKGHMYAVCILGNRNTPMRWRDMKRLYRYINKFAKEQY